MGKRSIIFATLAAVGLTGLAWLMLRNREPIYEGKPVSYWLRQPGRSPSLAITDANGKVQFFYVKIPLMDSNAVPFLVTALNPEEGAFRRVYSGIRRRMPRAVQSQLPTLIPLSDRQMNAMTALSKLGNDSRPAVAPVIRLLKESESADVRLSAIMTLSRIDPKDTRVREALMTATHDTNSAVRTQAQTLLNTFDINAPSPQF